MAANIKWCGQVFAAHIRARKAQTSGESQGIGSSQELVSSGVRVSASFPRAGTVTPRLGLRLSRSRGRACQAPLRPGKGQLIRITKPKQVQNESGELFAHGWPASEAVCDQRAAGELRLQVS